MSSNRNLISEYCNYYTGSNAIEESQFFDKYLLIGNNLLNVSFKSEN